jgi:hypothetical protein
LPAGFRYARQLVYKLAVLSPNFCALGIDSKSTSAGLYGLRIWVDGFRLALIHLCGDIAKGFLMLFLVVVPLLFLVQVRSVWRISRNRHTSLGEVVHSAQG